MKKTDELMIITELNENFQYISGKLFDIRTNKEIKESELKKFILNTVIKNQGYITKDGVIIPLLIKDIEDIMDNLLALNRNELWPELPLVTRARELGPIPLDSKLAFPLTKKQLIIINRMLFHPKDEALFITTGVGGSGKSTFLNLIKQLFDNDYSPATLSDLSNDFTLAEAIKHRLICSDELAQGELDNKNLKTLASKQSVFANPKHKTGYTVDTQSALFWCCNDAPKINATDTGILRRIVFYCRNKVIENPDTSLNKKEFSEDELLDILRYSLNFEYKGLEWKKPFDKESHYTVMKDNSVYICKDARTYEEYRTLCIEKGLKPFSEPNWRKLSELFEEWMSGDNEKCEGN